MRVISFVVLCIVVGCGDDATVDPTDAAVSDSGGGSDDGSVTVDAGGVDAGAPPDAGPDLPSTLLAGQDRPTGLAHGEGRLFWSNEGAGTVVSCDPDDCEGTLVTVATMLTTPRGLSVFGGDVYFVSDAGVQRCPTGGCSPAPVDVIPRAPVRFGPNFDVAVDADRIVATRFPEALLQCPSAGCADPTMPMMLAFGGGMMAVALTTEHIYFTRWGMRRVDQCPVDTDCESTQTPVASDVRGAVGVAVDETHVYWSTSNYQEVSMMDIEGTIVRCPIAGPCAAPERIVDTAGIEPFGVAVESGALFWTDYVAGTVNRHPL